MRILNTKEAAKQYSKFSMPGFRSGSIIKKLIACMYYFSIMLFFVMGIVGTVTYNFTDARDVILTVVVEILIMLILVTPVIAVGFSDYYDWHGIKLILIIIGSWCVLFTVANFVSSLFSDDFIKSTKPHLTNVEVNSDGENAADSDATKIDSDIIIDNIDDSDAKDSSASQ